MKSILEFTHLEAREYFLKEESYFNFDLPKYFEFQSLLDNISTRIEGSNLSDFYNSYTDEKRREKATYPSDFEDVNYQFLNNKDGKFAWRPYQLIHPALYVSLVHKITEEENWNFIIDRFKQFRQNPQIECYSLPLESETEDLSDKAVTITNWWQSIEQKSLELALDYGYVLHTDITNCYGSIYTHSVVWALHTRPTAKAERKNKSLIGNMIDKHLQDMSFGQTNGIPQGSVLMDFIAEMVLGYADLELTGRLEYEGISDFQIIRYRDDYRIFTNNPHEAEIILKNITEILIELNMRLNAQKTLVSDDVIKDSIKPDKQYWNTAKQGARGLQNHLLIIHELANIFPNSGSLTKALTKYFNRIVSLKETKQNIIVLISILVDIAFKNPRTYPIVAAILSEFLHYFLEREEQIDEILEKIYDKFELIPNTGHLQIWLQRITVKFDRDREYEETLCKKVNDSDTEIWNSDWLNNELQNIIKNERIVNEETIEELSEVIVPEEVELFESKTSYTYEE